MSPPWPLFDPVFRILTLQSCDELVLKLQSVHAATPLAASGTSTKFSCCNGGSSFEYRFPSQFLELCATHNIALNISSQLFCAIITIAFGKSCNIAAWAGVVMPKAAHGTIVRFPGSGPIALE